MQLSLSFFFYFWRPAAAPRLGSIVLLWQTNNEVMWPVTKPEACYDILSFIVADDGYDNTCISSEL